MAKKWVKYSDRRSKGKKTGVVLVDKQSGDTRTLLNPHGKYKKYSHELSTGKRFTNACVEKVDKQGKPVRLSKAQRAFRAWYKTAVIDSTRAYKAKNK